MKTDQFIQPIVLDGEPLWLDCISSAFAVL